MTGILNERGFSKVTAALGVAALAVTGFFGLRAATAEHNPPATLKTAPRSEAAAHRGYSGMLKKVTPAVVNIASNMVVKNDMSRFQGFDDQQMDPFFRQFFGNNFGQRAVPKERKEKALGSGVIVSPEGYILTNNHVVDHATEVTVTLQDKREFKAKVIGTDARTDIAVLKIDGSNFPALTLGDSSKVEVGDVVLAVGNPFGLGQTVTAGIVSATGRSLGGAIEEVEDFIQTDAPINHGNSGGALVDDEGHLIGINTAILPGNGGGNQGIGFAVPINLARHDLDSILKNGKVERGYLGIIPQDITPSMAKALGVERTEGALVGDVTPNSPASKGGLQKGDIITSIEGTPVTGANALRLKVGTMDPGAKVNMKVLRDGKTMDLAVTLGSFPDAERASNDVRRGGNEENNALEGVRVENLTADVAQELKLGPSTKGVLVDSVDSGSRAAEAGLQRGDVIQQVNRKPVANVNEFRQAMNGTTKDKPVLLLVNRQGNTLFLAI
jgi:serine protease Do